MKWNGMDCGHVAIYENESSFYEQHIMVYNPATGNYDLETFDVKHSTYNATQTKAVNYWGVLRPDFNNATLSVETGNSSVETSFSWNSVNNADHYNLRIWKNKLWEGDDYYTDWDLKTTSDSVLLPEGTYCAYVDVCFSDNTVQMSNSVEFAIKKGAKLDVAVGNTSAETQFSWNSDDNANSYNLRIWKNKLWDGDDFFTDWDLTTTSDSVLLPEGTYFAYVDSCFSDTVQMSNIVEFSINKGVKLEVSVGKSSGERIFKWNKLDGAEHFNLRIWKDELWKGDDYLTDWDLTTTTDSVVLTEGTYFVYVDTCFSDDTVKMSNVVKIVIPKILKGDCNNDGKVNISDAVLLQKYILNAETEIPNWKAADLCEDDVINTFDLAVMKQMLIKK